MELDHLAVAGETRDLATAHVAQALGVALQAGGEHAVFHTHNTLLGLEEGLYLEAIAINPQAPAPDRPRWFDLDRFAGPPRLTNWICRCDDLDATLAALPDGFGAPVSLQRGDLRWRMAVPASGILPFDNCAPALMQWDGDTHPAARLAPSGCRLRRLTVTHPEATVLAGMLAPLLIGGHVRLETGPAGLTAAFDTPSGTRTLT
ncbi:polyphosphate kinase [Sulfitobacter alexandrii]|uniref:Polyphosphate kinase n=2 Tax=Sulfitobacter alexandrii TaxID=1917485 RepID=A0A1J0WLX8_9RHOB|nr:polyphosphate kinase [Sulfitobacter alexandrii]